MIDNWGFGWLALEEMEFLMETSFGKQKKVFLLYIYLSCLSSSVFYL
jgi:hypothetical protein